MTILTIPMSDEYRQYADSLENSLERIYVVAREARKKGLDPALVPEPEVANKENTEKYLIETFDYCAGIISELTEE